MCPTHNTSQTINELSKLVGPIATMDALGTSARSDDEIHSFIRARHSLVAKLKEKIEEVDFSDSPHIFTFGDTLLVSIASSSDERIERDCRSLIVVLRKFLVDSLDAKLFFRGVVSVGNFYRDTESGIIIGPAIDDAASWFEQAQWIGIHATPFNSLLMQSWGWGTQRDVDHLIFDYNIPMKYGSLNLKSVNWPKCYLISRNSPLGFLPDLESDAPRKHVISRMLSRPIPFGVERKHTNTLHFFDTIHPINVSEEKRARQKRANQRADKADRKSK